MALAAETIVNGVPLEEFVPVAAAESRCRGHLIFTCIECGRERVFGFAVPHQDGEVPTDNPAPYLGCHKCCRTTPHYYTRVAGER